MIYILVLILLLIPAIRYDFLSKKGGEKVWYYVNLLILILLSGLRYRVGGDTGHYMQTFENLPTLPELLSFDFRHAYYMPFWYVYNAIFKSFGGYYLWQIVQAIITNVVFFSFFKKHTSHFFTAIVVYYIGYYFCFNMDIVRQTICICIFLLSYEYLEEKKLVQYYILAILAIGFHVMAILLLFVPLVRMSRKNFAIIGLAILLLVLLFRVGNFMEKIVTFVTSGKLYMGYYILDRYHYYSSSIHLNIIGMTVRLLICVPFLIFLAIKWFVWKKEDQIIDNTMLLLVFIQISTLMYPYFGRLTYFLFPVGIVFLINEISKNKEIIKTNKLVKLLVAGALIVYFANISYYYMMNQYDYKEGAHVYHRYVPYHTVFDPVEDEFREDYLNHVHRK